ncbi:MAG: C40 family peptidase [Actinobacteria bacterium]|nr:C40 family peptidase [Actinomycetota bacterium]
MDGKIHNQSGSISLVLMACIVLVLVLSIFAADVGFYLAAKHQAQNAADAAALAAVQQAFPLFATGDEPQPAAKRFASANGASLDSIEVAPGGERVQVEVAVKPHSLMLRKLGIGPGKVKARAAAEVDVEALLKSYGTWSPDTGSPSWLKGLSLNGVARDQGNAATVVVLLALQHLGKPYVRGATGPNSFDCSGLVCYVYAQIGVHLPRVTYSQVRVGRAVNVAELAPGDLVFFRGNGHVGIYMGGGSFIHAPHTGDVVRVSPLAGRTVSACRRLI